MLNQNQTLGSSDPNFHDEYSWKHLAEPSRTHLLIIPVTFGITFLITKIRIFSLLLWYFVSIPTHEMGHAVGAWFTSRIAIPIGAILPMAGFTTVSPGRSTFFGAIVLGGVIFLGYQGWKYRRSALLVCSALGLIFFIRGTFIMNYERSELSFIWAGVGGEFFLSTVLMVLSFYELPRKWRWDFFRFPAAIYGACCFAMSFEKWLAIRGKTASLPFGSFLSGGGDASGDMEKLVQVFGWTEARITKSYFELAVFCLILIVAHHVNGLLALQKRANLP